MDNETFDVSRFDKQDPLMLGLTPSIERRFELLKRDIEQYVDQMALVEGRYLDHKLDNFANRFRIPETSPTSNTSGNIQGLVRLIRSITDCVSCDIAWIKEGHLDIFVEVANRPEWSNFLFRDAALDVFNCVHDHKPTGLRTKVTVFRKLTGSGRQYYRALI